MSLDRCMRCGDIVDTDIDCQFYDFSYTNNDGYGGHCEDCRDTIYSHMNDAEKTDHERKIYE